MGLLRLQGVFRFRKGLFRFYKVFFDFARIISQFCKGFFDFARIFSSLQGFSISQGLFELHLGPPSVTHRLLSPLCLSPLASLSVRRLVALEIHRWFIGGASAQRETRKDFGVGKHLSKAKPKLCRNKQVTQTFDADNFAWKSASFHLPLKCNSSFSKHHLCWPIDSDDSIRNEWTSILTWPGGQLWSLR